MNIQEIQSRSDLGDFLNRNNLIGSGAEIGSLNGGYAKEILEKWRGHLFMVDTWAPQDPSVYKERQDWTDFDACFRECFELAAKYSPRVDLIRGLSVPSADLFQDGSLDFVYIDANHAYEAVTADIEAWYPKIHSQGLLCGHDFWNDTKWPSFGQVQDAVTDWNKKMNLPMHYTPKCGSWWFIKP